MEPTWAISLVVSHFLESFFSSSTVAVTALSIPRFRSIGFMPAATYFMPSRMMDWASTVAVVVPSPATSEVLDATSFTICAPMFSNLSFSSIFLGHGHAVLGHRGRAEGTLQHHIAALRAEGHLDRIGQDIDARDHAVAGGITKPDFFCRHLVSPDSNPWGA